VQRKSKRAAQTKARFIEPMLLLRSETPPEGPEWIYELKLDGYRAIAIKTGREIQLRSRNDNDFSSKYPSIVKALASVPDETVLDGELVAFDPSGLPSFNLLQNASSGTPIFYYLFDVLVLAGRNLIHEPLDVRLGVLDAKVLPKLREPIRHYPPLSGSLRELLKAVRAHGFEGVVAKRRDSLYEAGQRSGAWQKMRVNQGQEFVIGGYTPTPGSFDALIFGYYDDGKRLIYVGRTRNGFTPRSRLDLLKQLERLETPTCPFANVPEPKGGRWGQGLTAAKMAECRWVKPELVGQLEFAEWTPDNHLRHSRFVGLREDKDPRDVVREDVSAAGSEG
jgi:bifunctional non-homologous end joining protein LigD